MGRRADATNIRRYLLRRLRGLGNVARDLRSSRTLFLDRGTDRCCNRADFLDRGGDSLDGLDSFLGRALDLGDASADLLGGLRGLAGETFHLGRHDREAPAGFTRASGFDGRIERQQIGLSRNTRNQLRYVLDLLRTLGKRAHDGVGPARILDGAIGDLGGLCDLTADFANRGGQLFRRGGHRLNACAGLGCRRADDRGLLIGALRRTGHGLRGGFQLGRSRRHHSDQPAHGSVKPIGERN